MEILIILGLVILNGIFAMAEIALVSSRKIRLEEKVKTHRGARAALRLLADPAKFLSTTQVGISLIGVIAGAYGGLTISNDLKIILERFEPIREYAGGLSIILVVGLITYLSLIIGELVPKTIAYSNPEGIAATLAPFMWLLSVISKPIISFLSFSTKLFIKIFRIKERERAPVTENELKLLIEQGTQYGTLEVKESELIKSIFKFGDRRANTIMTPRHDILWLDINSDIEEIKKSVFTNKFSVYPVCSDSLDNVIGIITVKDFLNIVESEAQDIKPIIKQPLYIPENLPGIKILEKFRATRIYVAIVIDEYGTIEGLLTLHDLIENIFGELPEQHEKVESLITRREDGSMLIDGSILVDDLREEIQIEFDKNEYSTLGGYMMFMLNKIPKEGDNFTSSDYRFEVVDMDDKRVDKVLVQKAG